MKKLLTSVFALSVAAILILSTEASVFAENSKILDTFNKIGYGTEKEGLVLPESIERWYYPAYDKDGFPNLDFREGLKYWTASQGVPTEKVKLNKDKDGNQYVTLTPDKNNDGIYTVKFPIPSLKAGDTPGLLYKWRGEQNACQVLLQQYYNADASGENGKTLQVGHDGNRGARQIWKASDMNDNEWNIRLSINLNPVAESTSESYYRAIVAGSGYPEISYGIDIDDIQIVKYNDAEGKVYSLDGELIYDLNNLKERKYKDYDFNGLPDKVGLSKKAVLIIYISAVLAAVLVLLAAVFFIIKRRKDKSNI